jgi:hypothetical protein
VYKAIGFVESWRRNGDMLIEGTVDNCWVPRGVGVTGVVKQSVARSGKSSDPKSVARSEEVNGLDDRDERSQVAAWVLGGL